MRTPKILTMLALMFGLVLAAAAFNLDPITGIGGVATAFAFIAGSLKSAKELRDLKAETFEKAQGIVNKAKAEKRNMSADELTAYNDYLSDMKLIDEEIRSAEEYEKRVAEMAGNVRKQEISKKDEKDLKKYSLMRAIRLMANNKPLDGIEGEMHEEAVREMDLSGQKVYGLGVPTIALRAMTATGQTTNALDQGGMTIATEKYNLVEALRPMLTLAGLGAQTWGNLIGNIDIPKGTSATASWKAENVDADETDILTSQIELRPRRLAAWTLISKQLMHQSSSNIEQFVMMELMAAIAQAVELAALAGTGSGNNQPTGLLGTTGIGNVAGGVDGLAPAWSHIVDLESKVDVANALQGSLGYLTNSKVRAALKKTKLDTGSGLFIMGQDSKELNGYKAAFSNLVPSNLTKVNGETTHENLSAIIFGNFNDMIIGQWGGLDLIVDQYTKAKNNQLQITVNSLWDVAIRRPESFAAMLDAIA